MYICSSRIWTWLLFIHYLCICIPWQLVPRASLNLRDLYSHMERWKDNSVRICCINISTATGWECSVLLYIVFFLNRLQWADCWSFISLYFGYSCIFVHKSGAKDFPEKLFEKILMTPVRVVRPFTWSIFHHCLSLLAEPVALNTLLSQTHCYTNA